jgi:hypothetical protein
MFLAKCNAKEMSIFDGFDMKKGLFASAFDNKLCFTNGEYVYVLDKNLTTDTMYCNVYTEPEDISYLKVLLGGKQIMLCEYAYMEDFYTGYPYSLE